MSIIVRATSHKTELKPGVYPGRLEEIEQRTGANGEYLLWRFGAQHGDRWIPVTMVTSTKMGPKAKARTVVKTLLGRDLQPGESFDLETLYNAACLLTVSVETLDDGSTVNRVILVSEPDTTEDMPF